MNQYLVLRLADPYSWVITGADGGRLGPVATGDLVDAAPIAKERQVVVIAPGPSVTLARPELPIRAGAKLAQVVPYAMEESLAGEVEQFHFAIGATDAAGATQVAALRREELRGWLDGLVAAGLDPQSVVPDTLCIPDNPGKIVAVIDSGLLLVRSPGCLPVASRIEYHPAPLELSPERVKRAPCSQLCRGRLKKLRTVSLVCFALPPHAL